MPAKTSNDKILRILNNRTNLSSAALHHTIYFHQSYYKDLPKSTFLPHMKCLMLL